MTHPLKTKSAPDREGVLSLASGVVLHDDVQIPVADRLAGIMETFKTEPRPQSLLGAHYF